MNTQTDKALELFNKALREVSGGASPDLTPRQSAMLVRICLARSAPSVKELAEASGCTKVVAARSIDILDAHGFILRRPDRQDRRNIVVVPTAEGMGLLAAVADRVAAEDLQRAEQDAA